LQPKVNVDLFEELVTRRRPISFAAQPRHVATSNYKFTPL
jgi:hypothetical protein